jgi:hypothetical protein
MMNIIVEEMTRGGGMPLFKIRYAKLLKNLGPFAVNSLSRVKRKEAAPPFAFDEPSILWRSLMTNPR